MRLCRLQQELVLDRSPMQAGSCVCAFDLVRTLTGRRGVSAECRSNSALSHLTVSDAGAHLSRSFCARCFLGVVTEGDGGGSASSLRRIMYSYLTSPGLLGFGGAWRGDHSAWDVVNAANASSPKVDQPIAMYVEPADKYVAVRAIVDLYRRRTG